MLMELLRRFGLRGTDTERVRYDTVRLSPFETETLVKTSVRRVRPMFGETRPYADLFRRALEIQANLRRAAPRQDGFRSGP